MAAPRQLAEAARRRRSDAEERVDKAIRWAVRSKMPVTFRGISAMARVSTDFLYRHPEMRARIQQLRDGPSAALKVPAAIPANNMVQVLKHRIEDDRRRHAEEVLRLQGELAAARAQVLDVSRRLREQGM